MHRKHGMLPSREPIFACECLLFFRCPRLRIRGFRVCTRASRATSFIISAAVIWYTVLFRQNRTDRPDKGVLSQRILSIYVNKVMSWFGLHSETCLSSPRDLRSGHPTCTFRQRVAIIWKHHGQAVSSALPLLRAANRGQQVWKEESSPNISLCL
jgi:hypothetical protein